MYGKLTPLARDERALASGDEVDAEWFEVDLFEVDQCEADPSGANPFAVERFENQPFDDQPAAARPFEARPFDDQQFGDRPFEARQFEDQFEDQQFEARPFDDQPFGDQPFEAEPFETHAQQLNAPQFEDRRFEGAPFEGEPFAAGPFAGAPAVTDSLETNPFELAESSEVQWFAAGPSAAAQEAEPFQLSRPRHSGIHEKANAASLPPASRSASVTRRHAELGRLNHFELLGIPENADRDAIARAFQREAPRFHPDQLRGQDERLRPLAADIFRRMSEAYLVLENDESRERYSRELALQRRASALADGLDGTAGERLFQAARICLRRERMQDALVLVKRACSEAPQDLRYQALLAWLEIRRGGVRSGPEVDKVLALMTLASSRHSDDLELRLYRAYVLQRLGRAADAYRDFCFVAKADPLNVEAAREVRLHEMRSSGSGTRFKVSAKRRPR